MFSATDFCDECVYLAADETKEGREKLINHKKEASIEREEYNKVKSESIEIMKRFWDYQLQIQLNSSSS